MVADGYYTYRGDHFVMYVNVKSLCYIPETIILCHLYFNLKNGLKAPLEALDA